MIVNFISALGKQVIDFFRAWGEQALCYLVH